MLLGTTQRTIDTYDIQPDIGELPDKKPKTRKELTSKRTRYSTRFANPDGSFTEEIYQQAQFYEDPTDKKWKKINNLLKKSAKIRNRYENTGNTFKTLFSDVSDSSNLFSVQKEGYNLDLLLVGAKNVNAVINQNEISYPDILPQVDANYLVKNDKIKESLILKSPTGQNQYSFELRMPPNLSAKLEANGSISIFSPFKEKLWVIDKPHMFDSKGIVSNNVNFNIRKQGNRTFIDMTLDSTFLNDPNTSYPITVDPSFQSPLKIRDTFISNRYPQTSYSSHTNMYTGVTPSYGLNRSLIRFALPPLPSNSQITKATFQAFQANTNIGNTAIDLHRITSSWNDSVTWNTQPSILAASESSIAPATSNVYWEWDITKLSQDWYSGLQAYYGLLLKNNNESSTTPYGYFGASENIPAYIPKMSITYTADPIGTEDFWHQTQEGVNPSNGNLTITESDFVIPGRGVPLSVERTYNSRNTVEKGLFGYGWSSNLDVRLTFADSGPIVYTDADGTKHYFGETAEGSYLAQSGLYLDLAKQADGTFTLTLADKTTNIIFSTNGRIQSISDSNGNVTLFSYNASGQLQSVTDASNRKVSISYGSSGFVSTITVENRMYRYSQDTSGNLQSYTNAKNSTKSYGYDGVRRLTSRKDGRNITTSFAYDASNRVGKVSQPITIEGIVKERLITFSYDPASSWTTRYENSTQRTDFIYDSSGRVTQIIENISDTANKKVTKFSYNNTNQVVQLQDPKNQSYVYDYDDQGNPTFEKLPEGQKAYNTFDNQNNLIKEQDFNENIDLHDYDLKNNETESVDPYVQSVSKRYNSVGNLLYQTNPMSVADNLLPNGGFEYGTTWPDYWIQAFEPKKTAQFTWSTIAKYGNRSISISNPTSWAIVYCSHLIPYSDQETYVVSGYVKTVSTIGNAFIKIEYFDKVNNWLGQRNSYGLSGTHDWTRLQAIITNVPAETVTIRVSAALDPGQGTAYYDGIQLEKGNVVSAYNLIENSSFERYSSPTEKIPLSWSASNNLSAADGRDQNTSETDTRVYVGDYSLKLTGEKGKNKYVVQRVLISGDASTKFTLSGWSYQEGADPNGGNYGLQLGINYTDGTIDWRFANDFSKTTFGWQHLSVVVEPAEGKTFQSIDVFLLYYNQSGAAWFDAMRLETAPSHTSYEYDEGKNYVTLIKDPLGNTTRYSFVISGIQLALSKETAIKQSTLTMRKMSLPLSKMQRVLLPSICMMGKGI